MLGGLSFDASVEWVRRFGKGALLAKMDIESAFCWLPVHPESLHLLGCCWEGCYFIDCCLPMGCSLSCAYFEAFSSFFGMGSSQRFWVLVGHPLFG